MHFDYRIQHSLWDRYMNDGVVVLFNNHSNDKLQFKIPYFKYVYIINCGLKLCGFDKTRFKIKYLGPPTVTDGHGEVLFSMYVHRPNKKNCRRY